jgi:hypothetical protein
MIMLRAVNNHLSTDILSLRDRENDSVTIFVFMQLIGFYTGDENLRIASFG